MSDVRAITSASVSFGDGLQQAAERRYRAMSSERRLVEDRRTWKVIR
jgi:hypothetical protein